MMEATRADDSISRWRLRTLPIVRTTDCLGFTVTGKPPDSLLLHDRHCAASVEHILRTVDWSETFRKKTFRDLTSAAGLTQRPADAARATVWGKSSSVSPFNCSSRALACRLGFDLGVDTSSTFAQLDSSFETMWPSMRMSTVSPGPKVYMELIERRSPLPR